MKRFFSPVFNRFFCGVSHRVSYSLVPGRRKDQVAGGQRRARSTVPLASDRGDAVPVACHSSFSISFRPACLVLAGHTHSRHCARAGSSTHSPPDLLHFSVNYPSEAEDFESPELARPCATLRCNRLLYNIAGVRYRYSPYTNLPIDGAAAHPRRPHRCCTHGCSIGRLSPG